MTPQERIAAARAKSQAAVPAPEPGAAPQADPAAQQPTSAQAPPAAPAQAPQVQPSAPAALADPVPAKPEPLFAPISLDGPAGAPSEPAAVPAAAGSAPESRFSFKPIAKALLGEETEFESPEQFASKYKAKALKDLGLNESVAAMIADGTLSLEEAARAEALADLSVLSDDEIMEASYLDKGLSTDEATDAINTMTAWQKKLEANRIRAELQGKRQTALNDLREARRQQAEAQALQAQQGRQKAEADYAAHVQRAEQALKEMPAEIAGMIPPAALEAAKRGMTEDKIGQVLVWGNAETPDYKRAALVMAFAADPEGFIAKAKGSGATAQAKGLLQQAQAVNVNGAVRAVDVGAAQQPGQKPMSFQQKRQAYFQQQNGKQ